MSPQPLILAFDTSTRSCSVALTTGDIFTGNILASISHNTSITHSRRLLSLIDNILTETETSWDMLTGLCVGLGPGSFTGLRIGMATAKGLASASGLSLYGTSTLDCFVQHAETGKLVCSIIDARKKEVYGAFYRRQNSGEVKRDSDIFAMTPEDLVETINEPVLFVGEGVQSYGDFFREALDTLASFAPVPDTLVNAAVLGLLAGRAEDDMRLDIADATPLYIRSSDAELNLKKKKQV